MPGRGRRGRRGPGRRAGPPRGTVLRGGSLRASPPRRARRRPSPPRGAARPVRTPASRRGSWSRGAGGGPRRSVPSRHPDRTRHRHRRDSAGRPGRASGSAQGPSRRGPSGRGSPRPSRASRGPTHVMRSPSTSHATVGQHPGRGDHATGEQCRGVHARHHGGRAPRARDLGWDDDDREETAIAPEDEVARICAELIRIESVNYGDGVRPGGAQGGRVRHGAAHRGGPGPGARRERPGPRVGDGPRRGVGPLTAGPRCPRSPRRRPGQRRRLAGGPVRGRGARRLHLGPRRGRHEGHGRDDHREPAPPRPDRARSRRATTSFVFFADEEAGGVQGSHWVVDHHPELVRGRDRGDLRGRRVQRHGAARRNR